jgi:SAM-dependent methyltransferase
MSSRPIIDWPTWAGSAPGAYILAWEQAQLDRIVSDIFGFHALQLGLPQLDALRENRMQGRALVLDAASGASARYSVPPAAAPDDDGAAGRGRSVDATGLDAPPPNASPAPDSTPDGTPNATPPGRAVVWGDFLELPFGTQSVDLLVLPHTLEFTRDPHLLLREAERVLMPEGQLVISGFNSLSLWGVRQTVGKMTGRPFVPAAHDLIAFTRLKDWIKLLGFELDRGRFGCYRPPLDTGKWLSRYAFTEAAGDRWWPIFGAAYMITAVKRVRGMRLIGPRRLKKPVLAAGLAPVATPNSRHRQHQE